MEASDSQFIPLKTICEICVNLWTKGDLQLARKKGFVVTMRLVIFAVILVASRLLAGAPPDVEASRLLVGTWDCRDESLTLKEAIFTYRPDGTFSSHAVFRTRGKESRVDVEGKWKIKDGVLVEKLTKSSEPGTAAIGLVTRDTLVSIAKKKFRFKGNNERKECACVRK